ncbi:AlkA N-terminal domain-containing protein [Cellulomonas sp. 73-92]|uniref:AlkA N-terminal domain-containing protein n=1 Tax=Cellulomonas sp. 73-92 TaxID=1895740 RepID=UPI000A9496E9|nr:AlkA N-terminal domain-containing protein [Cellulomonas sp. 73-92]
MPTWMPDEAACRTAVRSRDARFDGWFFLAVTSTGIYCRPSCPARTPRDDRMRFFPSSAAAQAAGYRACLRCRPDASPGSPAWDVRGDVVARAMRLIDDGLVDRAGVPGLAAALGYSTRQLERVLTDELGAGPLALARARRAQTARTLVERTTMPMTDVAYAAGYASIRAFNDAVVATYALSPTELRGRASRHDEPHPGLVALRLAYRAPLEPSNLLGHLVATAVPGVEEYRDGAYRTTVRLPHAWGIVTVHRPDGAAFPVTLRLADVRDLPAAVSRTRRMLDLDADPVAVDAALAADERLRPLVVRTPGRRVPRTADPEAMALRAVIGQQVSTQAARTHAGRLVATLGTPVDDPDGGLTHLFPRAADLLADEAATAASLAMPATRRRTLFALAGALADGRIALDAGAGRDEARAALAALPGIGPWTVGTVAMRALGDPDAFIAGDLGVRLAAERLGLPTSPAGLEKASLAWAPWRAYAVQHLWATGAHPVNSLPESPEPQETIA